jgi:hypothetical protein
MALAIFIVGCATTPPAPTLALQSAEQAIATERLMTSGKGASDPIADNHSEAGRQQNRRVEVIIDNPDHSVSLQ